MSMGNLLQVYTRFNTRLNNQLVTAGSVEVPANIRLENGDRFSGLHTIEAGGFATIYDGQLPNFGYLYIASDRDLRLRLRDSDEEEFSVRIRGARDSANFRHYGAPFQLTSDRTSSDTINIVEIVAFNLDTGSARVIIEALR
jgi:hypothetical protein